MNEFDVRNGKLWKYSGAAEEVTIPSEVQEIGSRAFYGNESLKKVVIPASVRSIGDSAFDKCRKLEEVVFSEGLEEIGRSAFCWAPLTEVVLPEGLQRMGQSAFSACRELKKVTIPESLEEMDNPFGGCFALETVVFTGNRTASKGKWFENVHNFREGPKWKAFVANYISAVPAKLRNYAVVAFAEAPGDMDSERAASHLKYIKTNAEKLLDEAIAHPALLQLMCEQKLLTAKNIDGVIEYVQKNGTAEQLTMVLAYKNESVSAKDKKKAAQAKAAVEEKVLQKAVDRAEKRGIEGLRFVMTGDLRYFKKRGDLKEMLEAKGAKLVGAMSANVDYLVVNDPASDTEKCKKAKDLGIVQITERELMSMAGEAFVVVDGMLMEYRGGGGDVTVPDEVESIHFSVFQRDWCQLLDLNNVLVSPNHKTYSSVDGILYSKDGTKLIYAPNGKTQVVVPHGVTEIAAGAFERGLQQVDLPDTLTKIGITAFGGTALEVVRIPVGVEVLEERVLAFCPNLKELHLTANIKEIREMALMRCKNCVIYGPEGSYAIAYAKENNIPYVVE